MVLSPKSPLSPGVLYYSLQEFLLAVQKNVLVASNDTDALRAKPPHWVLMEGHHRHPVDHLPALVVKFAVAYNCWIYQLARKSQIVQP